MENKYSEILSQNKYTSPILRIAPIVALVAMAWAVIYSYATPNTLTLEEIESRRVQEMLQAQTQIDKDNLKTLSDCHDAAEKQARYPDEYLVIRSECYQKWKKPDVLSGTIDASGNKIYPWMSSGATGSSVPWRSWSSGSISTHVSTKIIYEKSNSWATSSKREADAPQMKSQTTGSPGSLKADGGKRQEASSEIRQPTPTTYPSAHPVPKDELSLLGILWLDHCSIKQNEDEHMEKSSGHIYGTDIACERGKSFTVSAPQWKKSYTVKSVGNDKRLGNYIVLSNWVFLFVFGHTQSPHKVWDTVYAGNQIGYTDDSGIATNVHLHFELWRQGYNITHDEMLGRGSQWNDRYSYRLLEQRGWYTGLDAATEFTRSVECKTGYSLEAYEDPKGSNRWSIGCGTPSKRGEKISKQEAQNRFQEELKSRLEWVYTQRLWYSTAERSALTAFVYNLGYNRPEFIQAVRTRDLGSLETVWRSYTQPYPKGLGIRRAAEWNHFISK